MLICDSVQEHKTKQPYYIHYDDERVMAMAGLYDTWKDAEGTWLTTFTILTTDSSKRLQWYGTTLIGSCSQQGLHDPPSSKFFSCVAPGILLLQASDILLGVQHILRCCMKKLQLLSCCEFLAHLLAFGKL